jgi:hypothetical protein
MHGTEDFFGFTDPQASGRLDHMARLQSILLLAVVGICHWLLLWLLTRTPFDFDARSVALPLVACISIAALVPMLIRWRGGERAAIMPLVIFPGFVLGEMIKMWLGGYHPHVEG